MEPRVLQELMGQRGVSLHVLPGQPGTYAPLPEKLHSTLRHWLTESGISRLYSHQAESYAAASHGNDILVTTGTSSGKSLCYLLPTLQACLEEPMGRALMIFPTKALAQDQMQKLEKLITGDELTVATYDGDTPKSQRSAIRKSANIILTNPDMLHVGILPGHEAWTKFLRNLRVLVIDEAHVYRGAFGGHVSWVIERLLRLCEWHGNRPQIIGCSATIAEPVKHFQTLTRRNPIWIHTDGAPRGNKEVLIIEATSEDESTQPSPNADAGRLLAEAVAHSVRSMVFCRARSSVEQVLRAARKELVKRDLDPQMVESYRGGYTVKERRQIEKDLFSGKLRGLATTNAMELGVDVGGLDLVILNGYPGSIASFWQQIGRAGRSGREGIALMIAHSDPLQQFLASQPELLFDQGVEPARASRDNPVIIAAQLKCAAYERALLTSELENWGDTAQNVVSGLVEGGEFRLVYDQHFYPSHDPPARKVNIRTASSSHVRLLLPNGDDLGEMELWRAYREAFPGAVYLHRGESYVITELRHEVGEALLVPREVNYSTSASVQAAIEPGVMIQQDTLGPATIILCGATVTTQVTGYEARTLDGGGILEEHELDLPAMTTQTIALRLSLPMNDFDASNPDQIKGLHTVEHVMRSLAPLIAGCDRNDIGSAWYLVAPDDFSASIYLYDVAPGGLGFCEEIFPRLHAMLLKGEMMLQNCGCEDGCPLCCLSPSCESRNEHISKKAGLNLISRILASLGPG